MNIGYAATGSSPQLSARMQYYRTDYDETVMNRDRLLPRAIALVTLLQDGYQAPEKPVATLASPDLYEKMDSFMREGVERGDFMPHDRTVAMQIAGIVLRGADDGDTASEQDLYARERRAFINLCQTAETHARIASMLDDGAAIRN